VTFNKVTKLEPPFDVVPIASITRGESRVFEILQIVTSEFVVRKETLELLIVPPPSGVIDEHQESVFIADPVQTRLNGFVDLDVDPDDDYGVLKRDGSIIFVSNLVFGSEIGYIGNYTTGNAGHTLSHFDGIFDDGEANASALTLLELSLHYPSLAIRDFTERGNSSYTISGDRFILMPPSIQNPVSITTDSGTIPITINVSSTQYFPDSGYLFTSAGSLIEYTSKTANTFDGCSLVKGANVINSGDELIPYLIS
jgi:hypothetical protein